MTKNNQSKHFLSLRKVTFHTTGQVFRLKDPLDRTPSQHKASGIFVRFIPKYGSGGCGGLAPPSLLVSRENPMVTNIIGYHQQLLYQHLTYLSNFCYSVRKKGGHRYEMESKRDRCLSDFVCFVIGHDACFCRAGSKQSGWEYLCLRRRYGLVRGRDDVGDGSVNRSGCGEKPPDRGTTKSAEEEKRKHK